MENNTNTHKQSLLGHLAISASIAQPLAISPQPYRVVAAPPPDVLQTFNLQNVTVSSALTSTVSTPRTLLAFFPVRRIAEFMPLRPLLLLPLLFVVTGGSLIGVGLTASSRAPAPPKNSVVIAKPKPVVTLTPKPVIVVAPPTTTPAPQTTTPAPAARPAPAVVPAPYIPPQPITTCPSTLPANGTGYNLGVLVIKYFPLSADGQNIDINVTGDVGDRYATIRQRTIDITNNLLTCIPKATQYLGYSNSSAAPSITYHVAATLEHTQAVPINGSLHAGYPTYPDYPGIMSSHNICGYVDGQGVHEVFLFAYQGPNKPATNQPYLGIAESKMSGPFGDISNSYRWDDMPHCQHTYVVYTFNYGRGTAEAEHSWSHQIEAELRAADPTLLNLFQGPNYPQTLGVNGRCGSVHNPPNARKEYDWDNTTPQMSDCENWNPDGIGALSSVSCALWGCSDVSDSNNSQLNYIIWNWQHLPGLGNSKTYHGTHLRNWWDVHGNFDTVMGSSRRLTV